jgi:hypothetical protein
VSEANPWLGGENHCALKVRWECDLPNWNLAHIQCAKIDPTIPGVRFAHPWLFSGRAFGACLATKNVVLTDCKASREIIL